MVTRTLTAHHALRVKNERAKVGDRLAILSQLNVDLVLPVEPGQFSLAFQGVDSWLSEENHPICASIGFRQGKLVNLR